jgi:hypothetical protein
MNYNQQGIGEPLLYGDGNQSVVLNDEVRGSKQHAALSSGVNI